MFVCGRLFFLLLGLLLLDGLVDDGRLRLVDRRLFVDCDFCQPRSQELKLLLSTRDIAPAKTGLAQHPQPLDLLVFDIGRSQVHRVRQFDQIAPAFILDQDIEQPRPAVSRAATPFLGRVVSWVTWQFDHVAGQVVGVVDSANVDQVPHQPLVVVCEVVDLIRQHPIPHHVCVVDPRRCFLLPSRILVAFQTRKNVSGHVPHVRDPRG